MSDRVKRWMRRLLEKLLRRFYEGEEAPARLGEMVIAWANLNPTATRAEWTGAMIEMAEETYRTAFLRGVEYVERDPEFFDDIDPDEVMSSVIDCDWEWSPAITLEAPYEYVEEGEEIDFEDLGIDLRNEAKPHEYE